MTVKQKRCIICKKNFELKIPPNAGKDWEDIRYDLAPCPDCRPIFDESYGNMSDNCSCGKYVEPEEIADVKEHFDKRYVEILCAECVS